MRVRRLDWVVVAIAVLLTTGCGGGCGGCSGFEPIPGGFPSDQRNPNAVQVRVTQGGLAAIAADPAALLGTLGAGMNGVISFNAPASCGGSTPICCPNGNPVDPCGPINIDLNQYPGDAPRLELRPSQGNSRLDVTVRARIKTATDIPVTVPVAGNCGVRVDTTRGNPADVQIDVPISFQQDAAAGTTRVVVGTVNLSNLTTDDVDLTGGFGCQVANLGLSFFIGILRDQLTGAVQSAIQDQTCKACPSGNVSECGPFADACTDQVCMKGGQCLQELGLSGRARGGALFGGFSPGTTGAIDLYEVAGGYATSNTNGLALGMLGGLLPAGAPRDRCGPPAAAAPARAAIPLSPFFQGNVRPDNNQPFDVGFGVHKWQLDQFAYAAYDGGLLCLTISAGTVEQLSTDTLSLISRSLGRLVENNSPMAVGLRPQSPPIITLGRNRFVDDGQGGMRLDEPLLDLKFNALELDFFAAVDDQYIRVFTVVSDVHLPIGLQVTATGELAPVIGAPDDAFTNISVKNSDAVTETPAELAGLFPNILALVLPQLSGGLSPISLPSLGGLNLAVSDITAVPTTPGGGELSFLAIFANLAPVAIPRPVETLVSLGEITEPPAALVRDPSTWRTAQGPRVKLDLGGTPASGDAELEWSWRIDRGTWSAWSTDPHPTLSPSTFWLPGTHRIEVRARERNKPETIDPTPALLEVALGGPVAVRNAPFHGQPGETGCNCSTGGDPAAALPFALVLGAIVLPRRRARRQLARGASRGASRALATIGRLGGLVWLVAIALLPGCSCGSNYCGDTDCLSGDVEHGALGRWTSIAADDDRVLVATYDQGLGDLVVIDVTDPGKLDKTAVDGIPTDVVPTHEEGSYRDGIEDPGPDVGAWTSIAISNGKARVAYQDRETGALKYAYEKKRGAWDSFVVDDGGGAEAGRYASMVIDGEGYPAIAYLALGIDDGTGHRVTELRLARAGAKDPGPNDWSAYSIATAPGTCGGLCGSGEACIAGDAGETCAAVTSDCPASCGSGQACVAGACTATIGVPKFQDLATGTGLFVSLVVLPDNRLAAVYYDRIARALAIAVENAPKANAFTETVLHGGVAGDRGLWASAVVDAAGTVHVAYQDAIGDQLLYTTWNGTPGLPEVVDDGQRAGDRTHPVGAAAAIYLVNTAPVIAYQDGMTADVYLASKGGASWTLTELSTGPLLDGFSIAATTGYGGVPYLAWDRLDPSLTPPHTLAVETP
ncbi:MAG: MYXO-CTERM sorting domain-containing protein [Kofleriaceae bacterium]